ncbi:MAG: PD-(D/E)XK nuclease family transposase [Wujia sp.]
MNDTKISNYFPTSRTRQAVLQEIQENTKLHSTYVSWTPERQNIFLDICTGARGIKITYDPYFKEIFNPEYTPDRLSDLLSVLLGMKVKVLRVLPNDSTRIASESSLLLTDIVVELADGSIANVEIQKIGYLFSGERASCYSSDLLLRQYKRLRDRHGKAFKYTDIKTVYTIVFFEKSPEEFHAFPDDYLHFFEAKSNTGLELALLQKYLFVPLDIFKKSMQNKVISNKLEAWLTFLSSDDSEEIEALIQQYPEFEPMYMDIYEMCQNTERIMGLFSKELEILDRNTVQFMIDEQAKELEENKKKLEENKKKLEENEKKLEENEKLISQMQTTLANKDKEILSVLADKDAEIEKLKALLNNQK